MKHLPIVFLCLLLSACSYTYTPLQFEPVRKSPPISPKFSESYYFMDRDQNLTFIMRSSSTDPATSTPIDQIATIRVFWRPRGGVTTLNPSALNATFRYIIMTPDAVGMYEGAGFVRLESKEGRPPHEFEARVMDGDLRLTQASKSFNDTLGRAHVDGYFTAIYDDAKAVDMLLDAHREFFARSLVSKPPSTATAPATTRAAKADSAEDWGHPFHFHARDDACYAPVNIEPDDCRFGCHLH